MDPTKGGTLESPRLAVRLVISQVLCLCRVNRINYLLFTFLITPEKAEDRRSREKY